MSQKYIPSAAEDIDFEATSKPFLNLPRWEGNQSLGGEYVATEKPEGWPPGLVTLNITLWRGLSRRFAWDGKQVWIEPMLTEQLEPAEACALLLLQQVSAIGAVKPKESFFLLVEKARPHLDPEAGGIFTSSYAELCSPELDMLCTRHRELVRRKNVPKASVAIFGFPDTATDAQILSVLGSQVFYFYRFPPKPGKPGLARAEIDASPAKEICERIKQQWADGRPPRVGGWPVRVQPWREQPTSKLTKSSWH